MPYSEIKSSGKYNSKFFYSLKNLNSSGGFIFWNSKTERWEHALTLGGSPIIAYLEGQRGEHPISIKGIFDWKILNPNLFKVIGTIKGDCPPTPTPAPTAVPPTPPPTPTPNATPGPTPTPTQTPTPTPTPTLVPKCEECNLGFKDFSNNLFAQISVGELTGTCANITDYRILWYGPNSDTNVKYVTAKSGSTLGAFDFAHPLTGPSAVFAESGLYKPKIDKIKIGSTTFSKDSGTGLVKVNLDCLPTVNVKALECSGSNNTNKNWPYSAYSYSYAFSNASSGKKPLPLSSTIKIPNNINYFAFRFRASTINDTLRITFNGSKYNTPIVLENVEIGSEVPFLDQNLDPTIETKKISSASYLNKVLTLKNLSRSNDDSLKIEIIPNPENNSTIWDMYFTCLDNFNEKMCWDIPIPYKISGATVSGRTGTCNTYLPSASLSGCTRSEIINSDVAKYLFQDNFGWSQTNPIANVIEGFIRPPGTTVCGQPANNAYNVKCVAPPSGSKITYQKYINSNNIGEIKIEFTLRKDLEDFYTNYQEIKVLNFGGSTPTPNDPTNISGYYRWFELTVPNPPSPNENCGDTVPVVNYRIHPSTNGTTAQTTNNTFTLTITMPTITNQFTDIPCSNCFIRIQQYVDGINGDSTGTTNNRTIVNNVGARYVKPFNRIAWMTIAPGNFTTGRTFNSVGFTLGEYGNVTYPMTGTPLTLVPSLSGQAMTANYWGKFAYAPGFTINKNLRSYGKWLFPYFFRYHPTDNTSYDIYAIALNNGVYSTWPAGLTANDYNILIGRWSANTLTIINPNYFV